MKNLFCAKVMMCLSEQHTHSLEIIKISFISCGLTFISVCGDACKAFRELSPGLQSNTSNFHPFHYKKPSAHHQNEKQLDADSKDITLLRSSSHNF